MSTYKSNQSQWSFENFYQTMHQAIDFAEITVWKNRSFNFYLRSDNASNTSLFRDVGGKIDKAKMCHENRWNLPGIWHCVSYKSPRLSHFFWNANVQNTMECYIILRGVIDGIGLLYGKGYVKMSGRKVWKNEGNKSSSFFWTAKIEKTKNCFFLASTENCQKCHWG